MIRDALQFSAFVAALLIVVASAGCAHYDWSSETPDTAEDADEAAAPVAVQTLAARASEGMRLERLTREFVETLQAQGLSGARWSEAPGEDYVECVIAETDVDGFGKQWSAAATVECSVRCRERIFQVERRGSSMRTGSNQPKDVASEHRAQAESAARRALRKTAVAIGTRCSD